MDKGQGEGDGGFGQTATARIDHIRADQPHVHILGKAFYQLGAW